MTDPDLLLIRVIAGSNPGMLSPIPDRIIGGPPLDPWRREYLAIPGVGGLDAILIAALDLRGWIVRAAPSVAASPAGQFASIMEGAT